MWPGLEFGFYRNDVTAVMASPDGNGIYRLLTKRVAHMGSRDVEVIIPTGADGAYDYWML